MLQIMNKTFPLQERMHNIRKFRNFSAIQQKSVKYRIEAMSYRESRMWESVICDINKVKNLYIFRQKIEKS